MAPNQSWKVIVKEAQLYRETSLATFSTSLPTLPTKLPSNVTSIPVEVLTPQELEVTSHGPEEIVALIAGGNYTSELVTRAYLRRATLAQRLVSIHEFSHLHVAFSLVNHRM